MTRENSKPSNVGLQQTRRQILEYLRDHNHATVDELAEILELTPVTVRHHLDILRQDELVEMPTIRRRTTPGRPQFVYTLAQRAVNYFPNNYLELAACALEQIKSCPNADSTAAQFEGIGRRMAQAAPPAAPDMRLPERLEQAVGFLNQRGYGARWEEADKGFQIIVRHCPYQALRADNPDVCQIDLAVIRTLVEAQVHAGSHLGAGAPHCAFSIVAAPE